MATDLMDAKKEIETDFVAAETVLLGSCVSFEVATVKI